MKNFLTLTMILTFLFFGCGGASKQQAEDATNLTKEIAAMEEQYGANPAAALNQIGPLLEKYEAYIALPNADEVTKVEFLLRAGEMASLMKDYEKSLAFYDRIVQDHPTSVKAPTALFMKGYTLDDKLKRLDEAKAIFELFLGKYPNDDFADDAQFLLNNLGKSEEEILKSFEAKKQG